MNRSEILNVAETAVSVDRSKTHGDMQDNFSLIATYWSFHLGANVSATDVAAMMALLKLARIRSNPHHLDSWVDVAGYAACGGEVAGSGSVENVNIIKSERSTGWVSGE